MSLLEAAASGDRRAALEALRDQLALLIGTSESARDVAALSGQLTVVLKQIEELSKGDKKNVSALDEIAERRKARRKPIKDGAARESS